MQPQPRNLLHDPVTPEDRAEAATSEYEVSISGMRPRARRNAVDA